MAYKPFIQLLLVTFNETCNADPASATLPGNMWTPLTHTCIFQFDCSHILSLAWQITCEGGLRARHAPEKGWSPKARCSREFLRLPSLHSHKSITSFSIFLQSANSIVANCLFPTYRFRVQR